METTALSLNWLKKVDPDLGERLNYFIQEEVATASKLSPRIHYLAALATLLGCQGTGMYKEVAEEALVHSALTPQEIEEITFQSIAYLGLGRTAGSIRAMKKVFKKLEIQLPLPSDQTTTLEDRLEKGNGVQIAYFGPQMKETWAGATESRKEINKFLADNCFGDYYTRKGLSDQDRELVTFCCIAAQGGCENQLASHTRANLAMGNTAPFLVSVILNNVPYIGYPRSLNALAIVEAAASKEA